MVLGGERYGCGVAAPPILEVESELRGLQEADGGNLGRLEIGQVERLVVRQQGPRRPAPKVEPVPCPLGVCVPGVGEDV